MTDDELEARMRQAISAGPLEPGAEVWQRIASRPAKKRAVWPLVLGGTAMAAGIAILLLNRESAPPVGQATTRVIVREEGDQSSFFGPEALLAQGPVYPLVRGEGPRGQRLRAGTWRYIYIRNGVDTFPGNSTYSAARGSLNGVPTWLLVSTSRSPTSINRIDSLYTTADSLRPLMRITVPGGVRLEQTFRHDDVLSGYYHPSGYINWKTTALTDTTRFNESSIIRWDDVATLFLTTPLNATWKRSIPVSEAAEASTLRPFWMNLSVDGEELVTTPAGTFDCWRIRLGMRLEPPKGALLNQDVIDEPDTGVFMWVSKDKGWLIQQGYNDKKRGTNSRQKLIEAREE